MRARSIPRTLQRLKKTFGILKGQALVITGRKEGGPIDIPKPAGYVSSRGFSPKKPKRLLLHHDTQMVKHSRWNHPVSPRKNMRNESMRIIIDRQDGKWMNMTYKITTYSKHQPDHHWLYTTNHHSMIFYVSNINHIKYHFGWLALHIIPSNSHVHFPRSEPGLALTGPLVDQGLGLATRCFSVASGKLLHSYGIDCPFSSLIYQHWWFTGIYQFAMLVCQRVCCTKRWVQLTWPLQPWHIRYISCRNMMKHVQRTT